MKKKTLISFYIKLGIFLIPMFTVLLIHIVKDPFKVVHSYSNYVNYPVRLNKGFIGWQSYLNHRDSMAYDSYIFGNSCTMAFPTKLWNNYLDSASPINLYGNAESLYAIWKKIHRLDKQGAPIKNVLLLLDKVTLEKVVPPTTHSYMLHHDISGDGKLKFQITFLSAYIKPKILYALIDYSLFGTYRDYMNGIIMSKNNARDQFTNDVYNPRDAEIDSLKEQYWINNTKLFPKRPIVEESYFPVIKIHQREMLIDIATIFKKHHTNYQIIINPEWNQRKFASTDLEELKGLFEPVRVHDFSGKNSYTENKFNFYEKKHYRPVLGKTILDVIYNTEMTKN